MCANSTGAFAALRAEYEPTSIKICGNTLDEDLANVQPYCQLHLLKGSRFPTFPSSHSYMMAVLGSLPDDDLDDIGVERDVHKLLHLFEFLDSPRKELSLSPPHLLYGADVMLHLSSGVVIPSHQVILGARSRVLCAVLEGSMTVKNERWNVSLRRMNYSAPQKHHQVLSVALNGCQPISVLILLTFLYSDNLLAIWDRRIAMILDSQLKALKIDLARINVELRALAEILDLPTLASALESPVKRAPISSLGGAMQQLFQSVQITGLHSLLQQSVLAPDIKIQLADRDVFCHSTILRARSAFFADFFDQEDWTVKRWDVNGVITIDMKHLSWRVMEYVFRFMCWGEEDMFISLDFINSVDEVLEFMFDTIAAAVSFYHISGAWTSC